MKPAPPIELALVEAPKLFQLEFDPLVPKTPFVFTPALFLIA